MGRVYLKIRQEGPELFYIYIRHFLFHKLNADCAANLRPDSALVQLLPCSAVCMLTSVSPRASLSLLCLHCYSCL